MNETGRFQFERFTDVDASYIPRVAIRQNGQIGFSSGAVNKYKIADHSYCVLFFDKQARAIGLSLEKEATEGAIPIRHTNANTYVRARNFLEKYEIGYSSSSRHALEREETSGLLFFILPPEHEEESPTQNKSEDTGSGEVDAQTAGEGSIDFSDI